MIPPGTTAPTFRLPEAREGRVPEYALEDCLEGEPGLVAFCPARLLERGFRRKPYLSDLAWFAVGGVPTLLISGWRQDGPDAIGSAATVAVPVLRDGSGFVADAYDVDGNGGVFVVDDSRVVRWTRRLTATFDGTDLRALSRRIDRLDSPTDDRIDSSTDDPHPDANHD